MKKIFCVLGFLITSAFGQSSLWDNIYGPMVTGCIQTSTTTSGNNRSVALTLGHRYILFGEDGTGAMNGATIRCIQGNSSVDVTNISGKIGMTIFTGQQIIINVNSVNNQYVSCISAVATQKYDLCVLP